MINLFVIVDVIQVIILIKLNIVKNVIQFVCHVMDLQIVIVQNVKNLILDIIINVI